MYLEPFPRPGQRGAQRLGVFQRVDLLANPLLRLQHGKAGRRPAQDQNRQFNPRVPKLHSLLQIGHREELRPQLGQAAAHLYRSVAVSVRLHHPQEARPPRDQPPQLAVIVFQGVQRHLCPGSSQKLHTPSPSPPLPEGGRSFEQYKHPASRLQAPFTKKLHPLPLTNRSG